MSDTTAPTLTALNIPTSINLSSGNVPLTISASATDNASGIDEVIVWFDKPFSTDIGNYGLVGIFGSGDSWADGSDSATRQVLSTNPAGTYTVTSVDVKDGQGNKHTYSTSELTALGFNTQIQFTGGTTDMTTVQITQQVDSQNGALKVLLSSSLGFWINAMDDGASLTSVAAGFINSAEFQSVYGANVSDRDYVTKLYNNVLDRNPDQGGYDFWLGALARGASREDILVSFSESAENIANVVELIANGIQYEAWVS